MSDTKVSSNYLEEFLPLFAENMKVIIVPGNGCSPVRSANWYKWLHDELTTSGIPVVLKDMPDPNIARESKWLPFIINKMANGPDDLKHCVIVGHSSGSAAAMRLAEQHILGYGCCACLHVCVFVNTAIILLIEALC